MAEFTRGVITKPSAEGTWLVSPEHNMRAAGYVRDLPGSEANARLWANAPELYDVVLALLEVVKDAHDLYEPDEDLEAMPLNQTRTRRTRGSGRSAVMIAHSGRIGLETIPYRLLGILSRERRDPTPEGREYWSGLISYLCDQLDCDRITLNNAVLLLELDGLTRFELESQGCLVIEVLRPVMIGRTARTGD